MTMRDEIRILSEEVLADLRSAAWLESELHPELDLHRRHEMADICEGSNIDRVWRVLGLSVAEIRSHLAEILKDGHRHYLDNELKSIPVYLFHFSRKLPSDVALLLKEKIHDYLVARVMHDRASVIIPGCAGIWRERSEASLVAIDGCCRGVAAGFTARRPLWPM